MLVEVNDTSAAFDARGARLAWFPPEYRGAFVVDVPLSVEETPYVRLGDWVPALAGGIALGAAVAAAARRISIPPSPVRSLATEAIGRPADSARSFTSCSTDLPARCRR